MSRSSRFSKLETEREGGEQRPSSGASLERFGAEPELGPRPEPVDAIAPQHGAERLRRFEDDGADGLGLDRDPLARLPMLQCPGCGASCGKFELRCHGCQSSLTTPEARAHNFKRLEALLAEREADLELEREKRREEQVDAELRALQARSIEGGFEQLREGEPGARKQWLLLRLAVGAIALGLAVLGHGGLSAVGWLILGLVGMTFIPQRVWLKLGEKTRRRY